MAERTPEEEIRYLEGRIYDLQAQLIWALEGLIKAEGGESKLSQGLYDLRLRIDEQEKSKLDEDLIFREGFEAGNKAFSDSLIALKQRLNLQ